MKKIISVILAAAMLAAFTGCDAWRANSVSVGSSPEKDEITDKLEWVLECYEGYYLGYSKPEDGLPMLSGTDTRASLYDVYAEDVKAGGDLKAILSEFSAESELEKRFELTDKILRRLCDVEDIPDDGLFGEAKLKMLRTFWGENGETSVPMPETAEQAALLEKAYTDLVQHYCLSLICSLSYDYMRRIRKYGDEGAEYPYMGSFSWTICDDFMNGEITALQFLDCCRSVAYFAHLKDKNLRSIADLCAYIEEEVYFWDTADEELLPMLEMADRAVSEVNSLMGGVNGISYIKGSSGDDTIVGGADSEFICGREGNDVLDGGTGNDHLHGGIGDDVYIIRGNRGDDVIFDFLGENVLRFENIPLENVYVSSVDEVGHEDDVKITFVGSRGSVVIKDFNSYTSFRRSFSLEFGAVKIAQDDPESPFMFIDDKSRIPQGVMPPMNK